MKQSLGDFIVNKINEISCFRTICAHDDNHRCVTIWSGMAPELIEAMIVEYNETDPI